VCYWVENEFQTRNSSFQLRWLQEKKEKKQWWWGTCLFSSKPVCRKEILKFLAIIRLKLWKNRWVWFGFISKKLKKSNRNPKNREKTEPKPRKSSQTGNTEPNRFELVFVLKNRTETGRFEMVSVFFLNFGLVFFIKTEPNRK